MLLPNIQLIEIKEKIANNKKYEEIDKMCFSIKPFTPPNFLSFVKIILSDIFAVSKEKVCVVFPAAACFSGMLLHCMSFIRILWDV